MVGKRDYGSFARATQKLLPALISPHGYEHVGYGFFARRRASWLEGFGLQQSQWGSGDFCINMGIHVPRLRARWMEPESDDYNSLVIAFRLSADGADRGDCWLPGANKQQLAQSLQTLATWLPIVDPWFRQFRSMSDVARVYRDRTNLVEIGKNEGSGLDAAHYGFLLAEAGEFANARAWLQEAESLMSAPVYSLSEPGATRFMRIKVDGARLVRPSRNEIRQLEAVRKSLRELPA